MKVTLETIKFNHDPTFKTTGAFYVRKNEIERVRLPEWEKDRCMTPECSPVAYAIDQLPKTRDAPEDITIKASFSASELPTQTVWIQAFEYRNPKEVPGPANILGTTNPVSVTFTAGKANDVTFRLDSERISNAGTSASDQIWWWKFSIDKDQWNEFQFTKHRVYVVPKRPTCPWEPESDCASNIHVPWTEALEYACHWAAGVTENVDLAAKMVTNRVYSLGKILLQWEKSAKYGHREFALTKFLALFRDGIGGGQTLNCDDCAAIVSTFANLLGAQLWQSSMGGDSFWTNPVLLIGHSHWRKMGFGRHSVAWKGECREGDELFDACLQIDGDRKPNCPPQFPKQPANIRFGTRSNRGYQSSLVEKGKCPPIPKDPTYGRQRRKFGLGFLGDKAIQSFSPVHGLRNGYKFTTWPPHDPRLKLAAITSKSFADKLVFDGWKLQLEKPECFHLAEGVSVLHTILKRDESLTTNLVDFNIYECADGIDPNEILLRVLSCFESFLERSPDPHPGELAFSDGDASVIFRRGRSVGAVRSIGRERVNAAPFAMMLDELLQIHLPFRDST